jgi:hypothetical protein
MVKGKDDIRTEHVCMYMRLCKSCHSPSSQGLYKTKWKMWTNNSTRWQDPHTASCTYVHVLSLCHHYPLWVHKSRRAWWITLFSWRRKMHSTTWENGPRHVSGLWAVGHDQAGGKELLGTLIWVKTKSFIPKLLYLSKKMTKSLFRLVVIATLNF